MPAPWGAGTEPRGRGRGRRSGATSHFVPAAPAASFRATPDPEAVDAHYDRKGRQHSGQVQSLAWLGWNRIDDQSAAIIPHRIDRPDQDTYNVIIDLEGSSGYRWQLIQGGVQIANSLQKMRELKIGLCINATNNLDAPEWWDERAAAPAAGRLETPQWLRAPVWRALYHQQDPLEQLQPVFAEAWGSVPQRSRSLQCGFRVACDRLSGCSSGAALLPAAPAASLDEPRCTSA